MQGGVDLRDLEHGDLNMHFPRLPVPQPALLLKKFRRIKPGRRPENKTDDIQPRLELLVDPAAGPLDQKASDLPLSQKKAVTSRDSTFTVGSLSLREGSGKTSSVPDPLGLFLVNDCDNPLADIIFVHGLGGSSLRTWSYNRDVRNFWLPWLKSEVGSSSTRVFTFGYNARFVEQASRLSILDFAKDLLFQLKMYHDKDEEDSKMIGEHPLIFVVHSMGGLVVKKAYGLGKTDEQYLNIVSQIFGIVFLGTPHRGSSFAPMLNNILRTAPTTGTKIYVNELEKGSTSINDINEQFRNVCGDLNLVSFYETLRTTLAPGVKATIVEKESAVLGYPRETSAPLHADHHGLTKFLSREDKNYRDLHNVLRIFVQKIKQIRSPHIQKGKPPDPIPSTTIDNLLGIKQTGDYLEAFRQRIQPGSCQWILGKTSFRNWIEKRSNSDLDILWLTGLPETGKTTLTSFIVDYIRQGHFPGSCQYHFFQAEEHNTYTVSYFLRSIAFQIAEAYDEFRHRLLELHRQTGILFASQKYNIIWEQVFEGLLFQLNLGEQLLWVFDGIDEAESPATIATLVTKIKSATPIRVLLVSRDTKDLSATLAFDNSKVYHEEIQLRDTIHDIRSFVAHSLRRTIPDDEKREPIIEKILSKSSGSFLWVKLVLERIDVNFHTDVDIEESLTEMPEGMELMYERMIQVVADQPPRLRKMATEILTWATYSFRPLTVEELAVALKPEFGSFYNLKLSIDQVCGKLVTTNRSMVALIHQTARQFLTSNDSHLPVSIDAQVGHERIARVCIDFLSDETWRSKFASFQETRDTTNQNQYNEVPFLLYTTTHWAYHVNCSSSKSEELLAAVFGFLERFSLIWINSVSLTGALHIITRSAQDLKSYAKRVAQHQYESTPANSVFGRHQELVQWANDLVRLVGRFGSYLVENPASIYRYIIPFCPSESMLAKTFRESNGKSITVTGISPGNWGDCLARLIYSGDEIASKIICKDNYFVTVLDSSGTLVVWNAETCTEFRRFYHAERVAFLTASKIKNLVASAGKRTIRVWDIGSGQEKMYRIPNFYQERVVSLAFQPNASRIMVAYDDANVSCIDLENLREQWSFYAHNPSEQKCSCPRFMTFSPDAKRIAVAFPGKPVYVWRISRHRQLPQRCVRPEDIYKKDGDIWNPAHFVLWQPNSPNLLILYHDTELVCWNIDDDIQTQHSHIGAWDMAISPDGSLLLTSGMKGLSIWSTGQFHLIYHLKNNGLPRDLAFAPDLRRFYELQDTVCNVWEPAALIRSESSNRENVVSRDTLHSDPVIAFDDNSPVPISSLVCGDNLPYYCTGGRDGNIVIYDVRTSGKLHKLYKHSSSSYIRNIAWSTSQKYIASFDSSDQVVAKRLEQPLPRGPNKWDVYPLLDIKLTETVKQLLFSRSDEFLLISSETADQVWNTESRQKLFQVDRGESEHMRRWLNHPEDPNLLLCIEGAEQSLHCWSNLEKIPHTAPSPDNLSLAPKDDKTLGRSISDLTLEVPSGDIAATKLNSYIPVEDSERVFAIGDHSVVLEYIINRGFRYNVSLYPVASRRLEIIDLKDVPLRRRVLSRLSEHVNQLVYVFQGRIVFLDHQHWLCTWELHSDEDSYQKHLFLPKDWLISHEALKLLTVDHFGNLLCPKNDEVAVVQPGIKL
ncbi:hypothetical protein AJ79_08236 [Helicocarpus griseus UAMH5409]|uniref:Uncharacterized protein n=1 Tax=Helicocarpus griseus UAMH5409 TaxID=1447875 RepID=A0A2B7WUF7_9EURO|nr:hypothetical protein AJ79_08236 [Helicocarpus griseus UAMH5409]